MARDIRWMNGFRDEKENNMLFLKAFLYTVFGLVALCLTIGLIVGIVILGTHLFGPYFVRVGLGMLFILLITIAVYDIMKEKQSK
jgi:uncharacterized membrane protein